VDAFGRKSFHFLQGFLPHQKCQGFFPSHFNSSGKGYDGLEHQKIQTIRSIGDPVTQIKVYLHLIGHIELII
jgi:hypothetical protein